MTAEESNRQLKSAKDMLLVFGWKCAGSGGRCLGDPFVAKRQAGNDICSDLSPAVAISVRQCLSEPVSRNRGFHKRRSWYEKCQRGNV